MDSLIRLISSYNLKKISGELFWIGLGQALSILGALVGVRLMTQALTPTSYGELALGMTVVAFTQQILWGPLGNAASRFFAPAQESGKIHIYLSAVWRLVTKSSLLSLSLIVVAGLGLWLSGYAPLIVIVGAALLLSLLDGYNGNLNGIQNAARQRMVVAWHQCLGTWLRYLVAVGLIYLCGSFSSVAMLGYCLGGLIVVGSQLWFLQHKIVSLKSRDAADDPAEVAQWVNRMVAYGWPFAAWGIFTWAQVASDRWALQSFGLTRDVGLYAVLFQLGYYPVSLLAGLFTQLTAPVLFAWAGDASDAERLKKTRQVTNYFILGALAATGLATGLAWLFHGQIFSWLVAPQYREVSGLLPLMVFAGGLFTSGQIGSLLLMVDTVTQALIAPKIGTALLGIIFNVTGAYFLGLKGVVFANIGFSLTYFLWVMMLSRPNASRTSVNSFSK